MNVEEYRNFCLSLSGVTEGFPFGEETLVFKVMNKMFALSGVEEFDFINLKCDPERAVILREQYDEIKPGWHMNKVHWNSVHVDGSLEDELIEELILHSYELVAKSLKKKDQEALKNLK